MGSLSSMTSRRQNLRKKTYNISANVHLLDLDASSKTKFQCLTTKTLLNNISSSICLHERKKDVFVSGAFHNLTSIWEEEQVTRMMKLLIHHPHLHLIDIGANIGTYTTYAAALGRFVLAVDCFAPNLIRLRRAIQLMNMTDQIVVVQNAVYTRSGELLRISINTVNIGGQEIHPSINRSHENAITNKHLFATSNPYVVKTILFDELLPILVSHGIRGALMKIDIEGSESFVLQSGGRVFDTVNIPFIQMEWIKVRHYADRVKVILDFFKKRQYDPLTSSCHLLNSKQHMSWPNDIYWLKRNTSGFC